MSLDFSLVFLFINGSHLFPKFYWEFCHWLEASVGRSSRLPLVVLMHRRLFNRDTKSNGRLNCLLRRRNWRRRPPHSKMFGSHTVSEAHNLLATRTNTHRFHKGGRRSNRQVTRRISIVLIHACRLGSPGYTCSLVPHSHVRRLIIDLGCICSLWHVDQHAQGLRISTKSQNRDKETLQAEPDCSKDLVSGGLHPSFQMYQLAKLIVSRGR